MDGKTRLATVHYLEERAKRGDRGKFERAMRKVADVPAPEYDRLDRCSP